MKRLRQIRDYLVENGSLQLKDLSCHIGDSEQDPLEQETENGINLFEDQYPAVIYIEDVDEKEYDYLKLLLYEWFRENGIDEERFSISGDFISDQLSLVTVDLNLKETVHLNEDATGKIERDGTLYSVGEEPIPVGI